MDYIGLDWVRLEWKGESFLYSSCTAQPNTGGRARSGSCGEHQKLTPEAERGATVSYLERVDQSIVSCRYKEWAVANLGRGSVLSCNVQ